MRRRAKILLGAAVAGAAIALTQKKGPNDVADSPEVDGIFWPVPACHRLSSGWGRRGNPFKKESAKTECHHGIDIPCALGSPVVAIEAGTVVRADFRSSSAGGWIILDHGSGWASEYMHLSALVVRPGVVVSAGEKIGEVGSTGRSTGPHLHLNVERDGVSIDAGPFFGVDPGDPC